MILVTVGSTRFDRLIETVDTLAGRGELPGEVLAQRGNGQYEPKHIESVGYLHDIEQYYRRAKLVICHGGTGTVFSLLKLNQPFIPVPNRELQDDHQADLLAELEAEGLCNVCWDLSELARCVRDVRRPRPYEPPTALSNAVWRYALGA